MADVPEGWEPGESREYIGLGRAVLREEGEGLSTVAWRSYEAEGWEFFSVSREDAVVLCAQRLSNEGLYLVLAGDEEALQTEGVEAVYRIGDCVAPQLIADCIFDGHRLAREIDAPSPAIPLPYLRERPVVAAASTR
jgi:hypothetical protein